jgi:hypothetical protein|tara:strand:- start:2180 stop:2431 length:252 start_codon:yes stop_codon:yes gene_type:complete
VECHRDGVDEPLIAALRGGRELVNVLGYDLRLQSVIDALVLLSARGVIEGYTSRTTRGYASCGQGAYRWLLMAATRLCTTNSL